MVTGLRPAAGLAALAVVFRPADPPRTSKVAFWDPAGVELPTDAGEPGELEVLVPDDRGVRPRLVPTVELPIGDAVAVLGRARSDRTAHPAAAFWGAVALAGLQLVARGRLLPGVSPAGYDAWRVGPLEAADVERIVALAESMPPGAMPVEALLPGAQTVEAMPAGAQAVPSRGPGPDLPPAEDLVRSFLDAVADTMPRSPAAEGQHRPLFAAVAPQRVPHLRAWAEEASAGLDTGVRVSLRIELPEPAGFPVAVQLHSLGDPTLVRDAAEVWAGGRTGFGPRSRIEATLAIHRGARVWPPLGRLLDQPVPAGMHLSDGEVAELLSGVSQRLSAAGIDLHWPRTLVRSLTARAAITPPAAGRDAVPGFFGGEATFDFRWQLAVGDDPLSEDELDLLAEATRPVVRLRDQWMLVDPDLARKARDRVLKPVTAIEAVGAALTGTAEVDGRQVPVTTTSWLDELRRRIADPDRSDGLAQPPAALRATLRDYQLRGLQWLVRMTSVGLGVCLADDMGLGKTVTLIALHLHRQTSPDSVGPTLVICPASLLGKLGARGAAVRPGHTGPAFPRPGTLLA
jgi:hypothetical protein